MNTLFKLIAILSLIISILSFSFAHSAKQIAKRASLQASFVEVLTLKR